MGISTTLPNSTGRVSLPKSLFGYEVLGHIGEGAASQIYVVSQPETSQVYALKHVLRKTDKDDRFIEQLESEYQVGTTVSHPGLRKSIDLKYIKAGIMRKVAEAALVLELFDGVSLEASPPTRTADLVNCFAQTAKALEALHLAGYVHCDLKPNNILINPDGQVKVIDLGQTCCIGTTKQRIQGTPDYISPEQVKCDAVTVRTDVYNLGATMYSMLTRKNLPTLYTLKRGDNSFLIDEKVPTVRDLNPRVPEPLSNVVMECVKVNPAKRPEMNVVARRLDVIHFGLTKTTGEAASGRRVAMA